MTDEKPFLRNAWYMAAWGHEVGEALLRRRLLGDPVLLFRKTDGAVAAMVDRCPHRYAPLSMGTRDGDTITCGYHGLTFNAGGTCIGNWGRAKCCWRESFSLRALIRDTSLRSSNSVSS